MAKKLVVLMLTVAVLAGPAAARAARCGSQTVVVLHGSPAESPGVDFALPYGLQVWVSSANQAGHAYVHAATPALVVVSGATRVSREGVHSLAAVQWSDNVTVTARACSSSLAHGARPSLEAMQVVASP